MFTGKIHPQYPPPFFPPEVRGRGEKMKDLMPKILTNMQQIRLNRGSQLGKREAALPHNDPLPHPGVLIFHLKLICAGVDKRLI